MPSWKKVIISGSDASLNSLSVNTSITASIVSASSFTGSFLGSLIGNAASATNASNVSTTFATSSANYLPLPIIITTFPVYNNSINSAFFRNPLGLAYLPISSSLKVTSHPTSPLPALEVSSSSTGTGISVLGSVVATNFTGSFSGSHFGPLTGTASWATTASYALVAAGGSGVTINNNTNNYLLTATGTVGTIDGEPNLQFDGSKLTVTGSIIVSQSNASLQVIGTGNVTSLAYNPVTGKDVFQAVSPTIAMGLSTNNGNDGYFYWISGSIFGYLQPSTVSPAGGGNALFTLGVSPNTDFAVRDFSGNYTAIFSSNNTFLPAIPQSSFPNLVFRGNNGILGYASTSSLFTNVTLSGNTLISSSLVITGSTNVSGSLTVNGGLVNIRAGAVAAASFTGTTNKVSTVTISPPFPNNNYAIALTPEGIGTINLLSVTGKAAGSFIINTNSSTAPTTVWWTATGY